MKHHVRRFKSLEAALKELEPFIRDGAHLRTGKPFKRFGGLRSREILANWLVCVVCNTEAKAKRFTFTSDPTGGDGIIYDAETANTWATEHVIAPPPREGTAPEIEKLILEAVENKQKKGGAAYASGKTLIVFLEVGGVRWLPNQVAKALPKIDFAGVLVVGLGRVENTGAYVYNVTNLDISVGNAPTWRVRIGVNFDAWSVKRVQ